MLHNHSSLNWIYVRRRSVKKSVVKNFAMLTERHLCWSLFLIKFFCLSEADQSLLKKEATKFLQSEEIRLSFSSELKLELLDIKISCRTEYQLSNKDNGFFVGNTRFINSKY